MGRKTEIDLAGEILPVGLLKFKYALEKMASLDVLCVRTDDPGVVENLAQIIVHRKYQVVQQRNEGRFYTIRILKQ